MEKQLELKYRGQFLSAVANKQWLEEARRLSLLIGKERGYCSVEDIREIWPEMPCGNWIGSIFKTSDWEFEKYIICTHPAGHARPVTLWRFKRNIHYERTI